jgi:hypothetical protein
MSTAADANTVDEVVKLPARSMKDAYDDRATLKSRRFVPEKY